MSTPHQPSGDDQPDLAAELRRLIGGFRMTQLIYVAAKLGVADCLAETPKRPDELARVLAVHPQALARLLRALSHYAVFEEYPDGRFALTALGGLLQSDIPGSLRGFALLNGEPWVWRPWGELLHSVSTGQTAFEHLYDMGLFDYVHQHADVSALLDEAMMSANEHLPRAIVMAYDFADVTSIVDVGGGYGELLAAVLHAHPQTYGVLLDLPETIEGARSRLHAAGVADRCTLIAGDFFQTVPEGGDIYILKWILHDWDDNRAEQILINCHRAMRPDTRLLIIEGVVSPELPRDQRQRLGLLDMQMLAIVGGKERTEAEYDQLLTTTGFRVMRIVPTSAPPRIIEAVRVSH